MDILMHQMTRKPDRETIIRATSLTEEVYAETLSVQVFFAAMAVLTIAGNLEPEEIREALPEAVDSAVLSLSYRS